MIICQVVDPTVRLYGCPAVDSHGFRCEEPHSQVDGEDHKISAHTIDHARAGNGWSCEAVESQFGRS